MKYLDINEALRPSQFREFMIGDDRYANLFKSFKGDHDRNYNRLYIPIERKKSQTHKDIEKLLLKNGYEILDYINGRAKFKDAKNPTRIGQILQRLGDESLSKKFIEDPDRKAGSDLMVCISRHHYDIAGADTDRNWTNCLTLAKTDTKRYKNHIDLIKKELSKVDLRKLGQAIEDMIDEDDDLYEIEKVDIDRFNNPGEAQSIIDELKKNGIEVDIDLFVRYEDEDGFVETNNEEFNIMANKYNKVIDTIVDIDKFLTSGSNVDYIKKHIELGVIMTYLIRKNDRNINDPIANLDIKPYHNVSDHNDVFLYPDTRMYGHGTSEFSKVVMDWTKDVNKGKSGIYKLAEGCYNDNLLNKILVVKEDGMVLSDPDSKLFKDEIKKLKKPI